MSGILCVHHASGIDPNLPRYRASLARLHHRGPDGEGHDVRRNVFLGVRRSNGSASGLQPLASSDGAVIVAFDGHLHNCAELAGYLRGRGSRTDLSSDPAVILAAYTESGTRCFEKLRGVWALVLWDERSQRLFIGRDPLGVRPLYYYAGARHLLVASEIKSIIDLDHEARAVDEGRVRDFIQYGAIDDWTFTCFSRIRPVPPGTVLEFGDEQVARHQYWRLRPTTNPTLRPADIRQEFVGAVERHMPAEGTIALALSGGIDSSAIAGVVARSRPLDAHHIHAFSVNPPNTPDESFLIDATIRETGLRHTHVSLDALDYPRALARLIDAQDEPIQYAGVFYQFVLRQHMAEAGCRSVLVGYGADEIFAGYQDLAPAFLTALVRHGRWLDSVRFVRGARDFLESSTRDIVGTSFRYARPEVRAAVLAPLKNTAFHEWFRKRKAARRRPPDILDVLAPPADGTQTDTPRATDLDFDGVECGQIFFRALLRCFRTNIPQHVRLEDRNAMAHGLELCAPFMDIDLVQTALSLPFHRYMESGRNKAVLREAVVPLLAPEVSAYRKKLATPGSDAYIAFEILRPEFLDLLNSQSFYRNGLWSSRCRALYEADSAQQARGWLWFRIYMVHQWYERVVRSRAAEEIPT